MRKAMLRDLAAHKARVAMTLVAIALGVAAVVASWIASESIPSGLVTSQVNSRVDVSVRGELSTAQVEALRQLPGEATVVSTFRAGVVAEDGKLVDATTVFDHAGTGFDDSGRFDLKAGKAPSGGDEIALRAAEAKSAGLRVGDAASILLADGERVELKLTGVYDYRPLWTDDKDPAPVVAFGDASGVDATVARVDLTGGAGLESTAVDAVRENASDSIGRRVEVADARELAEATRAELASDLFDLRMMLLPFAGLALLVGMFIIANTFAMLVSQRTRQLALLRAVGAKRGQVRRTVRLEALVLAVVGGTIGTLAGIAAAPALIGMNSSEQVPLVVSPWGIAVGLGCAVAVTVLASAGAARKAASVAPMAALRVAARTATQTRGRRVYIGLGLLLASVVTVGVTADPTAGTTKRVIAMCAAGLGAVAVLVLAPSLLNLVQRPLRALAGRSGPAARLAMRSAAADPRRTAGTSGAITIGLILVCAFATLNATLGDLIASTVRDGVPTSTTVLEAAGGQGATLTRDEVDKAKAVAGVSMVEPVSQAIATLEYPGGSARRNVSAVDPEALGTVLTPRITEGSDDLREGFVIAQNQATTLGLAVGDRLTVRLELGGEITARVAGVYEATEYSASVYVDADRVPEKAREGITGVYVTGADPAAVKSALRDTFAERPDVRVSDQRSLVAEAVERQRMAFVAFYAMFGLALLIALFGVVNTLTLSVMERIRELGVLRAIGANAKLVRRMVRVESLVIALFGSVLGIVAGVGVGAVMQQAMLGQALWTFTVPWDAVGLSLVGTVVAAVLAAIWPARRAARADPLAAIAAE
ncbi:ABC transporter permease [Stackebrandtia nassauensis]|uniref:ABC3 transporter permease protein domain-containing protein n=1 Tax=Stackebrandtia nassauensis (strain DSM 44728 / CIP 108903 / NRRL B-16338 / NBRC 102104 / LLR-40K-21) TaxID=446470 RepID=D3PZA8_STANL|nr:ABC transporter permease [Stackebrandtia nassauensis]ADD41582.1 protein of unknown function DUF214 [Stackebrandtia nassauensis DSM 44728]